MGTQNAIILSVRPIAKVWLGCRKVKGFLKERDVFFGEGNIAIEYVTFFGILSRYCLSLKAKSMVDILRKRQEEGKERLFLGIKCEYIRK